MHTLAAYQMELQPHLGQSAQDCVEEVCAHFSAFVLEYYRGRKLVLFPLGFDGRCERPEQGHRLVAARYACSQHKLVTMDWEIVPPEDPHFAWRISCVCAADRQTVEAQYLAQSGMRTLLVTPGTSQIKIHSGLVIPVDLLNSLLGRWVGAVAGWPIPVAVQHLQENDVNAFVDAFLLNPRRTLPVILLAADGRFKAKPNQMQELQRNLLGAAHVAALMNPAATERLTALLGPERACPVGVLRIYYPLFTRDASPHHHPLFDGKDLPENKKLDMFLHQKAMRNNVLQAPDGPVTRAARAAVCVELSKHSEIVPNLMTRLATAEDKLHNMEGQRDRLKVERDEARQSSRSLQGKSTEHARTISNQADELLALRASLDTCAQELASRCSEYNTTLEQLHDREHALTQAQHHLQLMRENLKAQPIAAAHGNDEIEEDLQRAWLENDQTLAELEKARREFATLQEELAVSKENLETLTANPANKRSLPEGQPSHAKLSPPPATVLEGLRIASERYADVLEVWGDAWSSAKKSVFPGPTRVMYALQAIAEVARTYFTALQGGQTLGPLEQAFRTKIPFKYAPCESQMTMAMYGHERVFQGDGQRREIQRHLTLGGGGSCVQVYFDFDEARKKVIIAHCGQHLPHYRQS